MKNSAERGLMVGRGHKILWILVLCLVVFSAGPAFADVVCTVTTDAGGSTTISLPSGGTQTTVVPTICPCLSEGEASRDITLTATCPGGASASATVTCKNGCGNGNKQCAEECDDGNPASGDGCDAACKLECPTGFVSTPCATAPCQETASPLGGGSGTCYKCAGERTGGSCSTVIEEDAISCPGASNGCTSPTPMSFFCPIGSSPVSGPSVITKYCCQCVEIKKCGDCGKCITDKCFANDLTVKADCSPGVCKYKCDSGASHPDCSGGSSTCAPSPACGT